MFYVPFIALHPETTIDTGGNSIFPNSDQIPLGLMNGHQCLGLIRNIDQIVNRLDHPRIPIFIPNDQNPSIHRHPISRTPFKLGQINHRDGLDYDVFHNSFLSYTQQ